MRLGHQFHHEKRHRGLPRAVRAGEVDLGDVRMPQPAEHLGLVPKPRDLGRRGEDVAQHLHGHEPVGGRLPRLVDAAHAPLAEQPHDRDATEIGAGRELERRFEAEPERLRTPGQRPATGPVEDRIRGGEVHAGNVPPGGGDAIGGVASPVRGIRRGTTGRMDAPAQPPSELDACLARLAAGDHAARGRIIELCADRLRAVTHRMLARFPNVRRWDDTDDVFQAAALRLHRTLGQLPVGSPRALLALAATMVRRELLDLARRHAGPRSYAANHATHAPWGVGTAAGRHVDALAFPEESLDRWTAFQEAVESLPGEAREVFHLVWFLGADQKTIATLLGCSERTVKSRWREAREAVKAALGGASPEA